MSSKAKPIDSNSVIDSSDGRPLTLPATTSCSSLAMSQRKLPLGSSHIRSPHSILAWSKSSTTITSERSTVSSSTSRRIQWLPPAAFTWAPGDSHSPSSAGSLAEVMTITTSAPSTHSWALSTAFTSTFKLTLLRSANAVRRSSFRLKTLTPLISRTAQIASS